MVMMEVEVEGEEEDGEEEAGRKKKIMKQKRGGEEEEEAEEMEMKRKRMKKELIRDEYQTVTSQFSFKPLNLIYRFTNTITVSYFSTVMETRQWRQTLTRDPLVPGQRQQRHPGPPQVGVHTLLLMIEHVEEQGLRLQVPVQLRVHGDGVGPQVLEFGGGTAKGGGSRVVPKVIKLIDHKGARRGHRGAGPPQVSAAMDCEEELVPARQELQGRNQRCMRRQQEEEEEKKPEVYVLGRGGTGRQRVHEKIKRRTTGL